MHSICMGKCYCPSFGWLCRERNRLPDAQHLHFMYVSAVEKQLFIVFFYCLLSLEFTEKFCVDKYLNLLLSTCTRYNSIIFIQIEFWVGVEFRLWPKHRILIYHLDTCAPCAQTHTHTHTKQLIIPTLSRFNHYGSRHIIMSRATLNTAMWVGPATIMESGIVPVVGHSLCSSALSAKMVYVAVRPVI